MSRLTLTDDHIFLLTRFEHGHWTYANHTAEDWERMANTLRQQGRPREADEAARVAAVLAFMNTTPADH